MLLQFAALARTRQLSYMLLTANFNSNILYWLDVTFYFPKKPHIYVCFRLLTVTSLAYWKKNTSFWKDQFSSWNWKHFLPVLRNQHFSCMLPFFVWFFFAELTVSCRQANSQRSTGIVGFDMLWWVKQFDEAAFKTVDHWGCLRVPGQTCKTLVWEAICSNTLHLTQTNFTG